ncbi:MAG: STAS domain-containing protein [Nitrospinae bacterium]|nr:STAS domain-containing protein [Nitrospinota bacterium]
MEVTKIDVSNNGNDLKASLKGKLITIEENNSLETFFKTFLDKGVKKFLINMSEVTHINSSGLGLIVKYFQKIKAVDGAIVFCYVQKDVNELFQMTRLNKKIKMFKTEEEAKEYLAEC